MIVNNKGETPLMLANGNQPIIDAFNPPQPVLPSQQQSFPLPIQPIGKLSSEQHQLALSKTSFTQVNVPADGSCLFWAVTLSYLMPVKNDEAALQQRCERLFGDVASSLEPIKGWLRNYQPTLQARITAANPALIQKLVTETLRNRVINQLDTQESRLKETVTLHDFVKSQNQNFITTGGFLEEFESEFRAEIGRYGIDTHRLKPTVLDQTDIESMDSELDKLDGLQERVKQFKFRQYLEQMRKTTSWGGNHELQAISQLLERSIKVFSGDVIHTIHPTTHPDSNHVPLYLFNQDETHYQLGLIKANLLRQAIQDNQLAMAKSYLALGVDNINQQDSEGWSALHFAAQRGDVTLVELLLTQGARTDSKNHLAVAQLFEQNHIVRILSKPEPSPPRVVGQPAVIDTLPVQHLAQPKRKDVHEGEENTLIKKSKVEDTALPPDQQIKQIATEQKPKLPLLKSKIPVVAKRTHVEGNRVDASQVKAVKADLREANYAASGLKLSLHGTAYQLKLLMLFLKRGLDKGYAFRLATEMDAAEKFDDVVFEYRQRNKSHYRFLQAKHKQDDAEKITADALFKEKKEQKKQKNDFSLQKYFNSYRKIKEKAEFKDGEIDDVIIYTNIGFDVEVTANGDSQFKKLAKKELYVEKVETTDDVLDVGGERYRLASRSHQDKRDKVIAELTPLFERGSDLNQLATLLAQSLLGKKDNMGNPQKIGLNEPLFKQYHRALVKEVINIDDKRFYADFLAGQSLASPTQAFRSAFRDAIHRYLQRKKNLTTEDKALLDTFTDRPVSKIPLLMTSDRKSADNEQAFWQQMGKRTFNLSEQFGKISTLASNPQLTDIQKFAHEIAALIKQGSDNKIIKIERRKPVIASNIDKLAGHVLVHRDEGEKGKNYFSTHFLQPTQSLPSALQTFRDHLKAALEQQKIPFDTLDQYQLTITKFQTCQEQALEALLTEQTRLPESQVTTQEMEEFIDKLVFAVNQPNEIELGELINSEMDEEFNLIDSDLVASQIQNEMFNWFKEKGKQKGKEGKFLSHTGGEEIFTWAQQKVNSLISIGPTLDYQAKIKELDIHFNQAVFTPLHNFITAGQQILHWIAPEETLLSAIKVYQALTTRPEYQKQDSYLFMQLSALARPEIQQRAVSAFAAKRSHHLLVIEGTSAAPTVYSLYQRLSKVLRENPQKKIILIAQEEALAARFKTGFKDKIQTENDNPRFGDFTPDAQQKLLAKKVNFQGYEVSLNQLIDVNQKELIDSISLPHLLDSKWLVIGNKLPISSGYDEDYYIERTFNHQVTIKGEIFNDTREKKFPDLLASTEEEFKQLYQQHPKSNQEQPRAIHWLKRESNKVIWKQSQGSLAALREYIDTHHPHAYPPENLNGFLQQAHHHKAMLISDETGMGKSTVLTHLSKQLKQKFTTHWVVRINLNDYTPVLKAQTQQGSAELDSDSAVEFVSQKLLKLETPLEQALFKECLKREGKVRVILLLDGFDEISPNYEDNVINLLQALRKTSIAQIWVTTRPYVRGVLEDELKQLSYTLEPFSSENQISFLTRFWKKELNLAETSQPRLAIYAKVLIKKLARSISDKGIEFTGIPLQTRLLAESFKKEVALSNRLAKETLDLPDKLDLLGLYERFIDEKYNIYQEEKAKTPVSNVAAEEQRKRDLSVLRKVYQRLAFKELFTEEQVSFLQYKSRPSKFSNEELARIGIIQIVNDKPLFIHRTFAEYFAAEFLTNQLKKKNQRQEVQDFLLMQILPQEDYQVIRAFLNSWFEKDKLLDNTSMLTEYGKRIDKLSKQNDFMKNRSDEKILHQLVREGYTQIISFLLGSLKNGGYTTTLKNLLLATDNKLETAWHLAAESGNVELLEKLWAWGKEAQLSPQELKDLLLAKGYGRTAWHLAAEQGHLEVLEKLWMWGKDKLSLEELKELLSDNKKIVWLAIKGKHIEVLKKLCGWVKEVNIGENELEELLLGEIEDNDFFNKTPWHLAVSRGDIELLKKLWELSPEDLKGRLLIAKFKQKQLNVLPYYEKTAWHLAAEQSYVKILENLWEWGKDKLSSEARINDLLLAKIGYGNDWSENWEFKITPLGKSRDLSKEHFKSEADKQLRGKKDHGQTAWHLAANNGHVKVLEKLWELSPEGLKKELVLIQDNNGQTAWHLAANNGHVNILEKLWELSPEELKKELVLIQDNHGQTAWHLAANNGHVKVLEKLWELSPEELKKELVLIQDDHGQTAWHLAANNNHVKILEKLWELSPEELKKKLLLFQDNDGKTAWHLVAERGYVEALEKLWELSSEELKKKLLLATLTQTKKNTTHINQETAWHLAAKHGKVNVLEKLWNWSRKIFTQDELKKLFLAKTHYRSNTWEIAAQYGHVEVLGKLFEWGKEILTSEELKSELLLTKKYFWLAERHGKVEVFEKLWELSKKANLDERDLKELLLADRQTVLLITRNKRVGVLEILCEWVKKANLNEKEFKELFQDKDGKTTWHLAAARGDIELFERLWELIPEALKGESLLTAAKEGRKEVVRLLIEKGADVFARNNHDTVLHQAVSSSNLELLRFVLEAIKDKLNNDPQKIDAAINARDNEGDTPLMWAIEKGKVSAVQLLLKNVTNLNIKNNDGMTALNWAAKGKYWDIAVYLLNVGATIHDLNDEQYHELRGYVQNSHDENNQNTLLLLEALKLSIADTESESSVYSVCQ